MFENLEILQIDTASITIPIVTENITEELNTTENITEELNTEDWEDSIFTVTVHPEDRLFFPNMNNPNG